MNNVPLDAERSSAPEITPQTDIPSTDMESSKSSLPASVESEKEQMAMPSEEASHEDAATNDPAEENSSPQEADSTPKEKGTGLASRCFSCFSFAGPLVLLLLWVIQAIPNLLGREPRTLHELTAGLQTCYLGADPWLTEQLASHPISDMTPVYNWFLKGLSLIPGLDSLLASIPGIIPAGVSSISPYPELLPLGTALASLFLVLLTWCLARATGSNRKVAFAAGLVLLTGLAWMGLPSLAGDELLGAALMTLTSICLYRGWKKDFAPLWLLCGFALVAVSTLTAGLPGLAFPLLTSLFFLTWRGTFRRGGARDGAIAFGVMLILLCAWGTLVAFSDGGRELLKNEIEVQFIAPILYGWELQGRDSWIVFATLALIWLPWTLLIFFLPWERIGSFLRRIGSNRRECPGQGWLWCSLLVGLIVYALLGAVSPLLLPPLLPPLAILTAQGLLGIGERRSRIFFLILALVFALLGLLHAVISLYPLAGTLPPVLAAIQSSPLPLAMAAIPVVCFLLFALLLWKAVDRSHSDGALLVFTLLALILSVPLACLSELPAAPLPQQTLEVPSPDSPVLPEQAAIPDSSAPAETSPASSDSAATDSNSPEVMEASPAVQEPQMLPAPLEEQAPVPEISSAPTEGPLPAEEDLPAPAQEKPVPTDSSQNPQVPSPIEQPQ